MGNVDRGAPRSAETQSYVAELAPQFTGMGSPLLLPSTYRPPANYQNLLIQTDIAQILAAPAGEKQGLLFDIIQKREAEANKAPATAEGMQDVKGAGCRFRKVRDTVQVAIGSHRAALLRLFLVALLIRIQRRGKRPQDYMFDDKGGLSQFPAASATRAISRTCRQLEKSWRDEFKKPIEQGLRPDNANRHNSQCRQPWRRYRRHCRDHVIQQAVGPWRSRSRGRRCLDVAGSGLGRSAAGLDGNKQEGDVLPPELRQRMLALSEQILYLLQWRVEKSHPAVCRSD